jgi:hypothetical protein
MWALPSVWCGVRAARPRAPTDRVRHGPPGAGLYAVRIASMSARVTSRRGLSVLTEDESLAVLLKFVEWYRLEARVSRAEFREGPLLAE